MPDRPRTTHCTRPQLAALVARPWFGRLGWCAALVALAIAPRLAEVPSTIGAGDRAAVASSERADAEILMIHPPSGQVFRVPGIVPTPVAELPRPRVMLPPKS
jgi:hypothetical protein